VAKKLKLAIPGIRGMSYAALAGCVLVLLHGGAAPTASGEAAAQQSGTASAPPLQDRVDGHRPLRGNPPPATPAPASPQTFSGYPDAPSFTVLPRQDNLNFFPCEDCHALMPPNPQRRQLYSPHPATLDHGDGRLWCLDCHAAEDRNTLHTLAGESVGFDDAYLVCGQCHYQPQKDWYFGAHGKRLANWQGERQLYNCTHCHNPHAPAVRPRAPEPPPPLRRGLQPMHADPHVASNPEEVHDEGP
jgi:hypothetical protein